MPDSKPELIATYWTIAGNVEPLGPPEREASPFDFRLRVEAAARAGFVGVGLIESDLRMVRRQYDFPTMAAILADHGMRHTEFEFVVGWLDDGAAGQAAQTSFDYLLEAAGALGARQIKIGPDMHARSWPLEHMIERFAALCARAQTQAVAVALEIMPWTNLRTIDDGLAVVAGADAPNGGLLLDIWHLARGGQDYANISRIPARYIQHIEIDDADRDVVGTLLEDTLDRRRLCGEGVLDVSAFLRAVQASGYSGPYGVEIISHEQRQRSLDVAAQLACSTSLAQFPPSC